MRRNDRKVWMNINYVFKKLNQTLLGNEFIYEKNESSDCQTSTENIVRRKTPLLKIKPRN